MFLHTPLFTGDCNKNMPKPKRIKVSWKKIESVLKKQEEQVKKSTFVKAKNTKIYENKTD